MSLDVTSASDVSMHTLGLVANYRAEGTDAADVIRAGLHADSSERARQHRPRISDVLAGRRRRAVVIGGWNDRRGGRLLDRRALQHDGERRRAARPVSALDRCAGGASGRSTRERATGRRQRGHRRQPDHSRRRQRSADAAAARSRRAGARRRHARLLPAGDERHRRRRQRSADHRRDAADHRPRSCQGPVDHRRDALSAGEAGSGAMDPSRWRSSGWR